MASGFWTILSWNRPGLPGELASQLDRAVVSTVANITEGAGRESKADKKRHYAIARGSATEAGGLVEIVAKFGDERITVR